MSAKLAGQPHTQGCIKLRFASPLCLVFAFPLSFLLSFFFFFLLVMVILPPHLVRSLSSASVVGFSGSRSFVAPAGLLPAVFSCVSTSASVVVGCARGLDFSVRVAFPRARVFYASSFGRGAGSFARRSCAVVRACSSAPSSVWVSFPASPCPAGLVPSPLSSVCFRGLGSGSWASLALACGLGVPCFVWLPPTVSPPAGWGFLGLGGGWWFACGVV